MKKNYLCLALLLSIGGMASAIDLNFIDNNLADFANRVFDDKQEAAMFVQYYANILDKSTGLDGESKKTFERYLHQVGLEGVKKEHPEWYASIAPFVTDPCLTLDKDLNQPREIMAGFLHRYGAYQEFIKRRPAPGLNSHEQHQSTGWFTVFTNTLSHIGSTIAGWFGSREDAA